MVFETGDKDYYWLNNVVAIGLLSNVEGGGEDSFVLRIDVWHVSSVLHFLVSSRWLIRLLGDVDGMSTLLTALRVVVDDGERSDEVCQRFDGRNMICVSAFADGSVVHRLVVGSTA